MLFAYRTSSALPHEGELQPTDLGYQIHRAVILSGGKDKDKAREAADAVAAIRLEDPRLSETDRERLKSLRQAVSTR